MSDRQPKGWQRSKQDTRWPEKPDSDPRWPVASSSAELLSRGSWKTPAEDKGRGTSKSSKGKGKGHPNPDDRRHPGDEPYVPPTGKTPYAKEDSKGKSHKPPDEHRSRRGGTARNEETSEKGSISNRESRKFPERAPWEGDAGYSTMHHKERYGSRASSSQGEERKELPKPEKLWDDPPKWTRTQTTTEETSRKEVAVGTKSSESQKGDSGHSRPRATAAEESSQSSDTRMADSTSKRSMMFEPSAKRARIEAEVTQELNKIEEQDTTSRILHSQGIISDDEMIVINTRIMKRIEATKQRLVDLDAEESYEAAAIAVAGMSDDDDKDGNDEEGFLEEAEEEPSYSQDGESSEIPIWASAPKKSRTESSLVLGWNTQSTKLAWGNKRAVPPLQVLQQQQEMNAAIEEEEELPVWAHKRAQKPVEQVIDKEELVPIKVLQEHKVPGIRLSTSMSERDKRAMKIYSNKALEIYQTLERAGYELDVNKVVIRDEVFQVELFEELVKPSRPRTGIRYANLMLRLLNFNDKAPLDRNTIVDWMMKMKEEKVGTRTLQAGLYAIEFFSGRFGLQPDGSVWSYCKRIAFNYMKEHQTEVSRADSFSKKLMTWLEEVTLDEERSAPDRLVAARLRMCAGASIRHNDMINTPVSRCEWVALPTDQGVRALRTRARQTKTEARHWIVSHLGMSSSNDQLLPTAVLLLGKAHGETYFKDDHLGKSCTQDRSSFIREPPTYHADVTHIRILMTESGKFSDEEIRKFRWHGAKATMTSLMQHLQCDARAIRHAGAWQKAGEGMEDTYLREKQAMALAAQEKCLLHLRSGGDTSVLTRTQIDPNVLASTAMVTKPLDESTVLVAETQEGLPDFDAANSNLQIKKLMDEVKLPDDSGFDEVSVRADGDDDESIHSDSDASSSSSYDDVADYPVEYMLWNVNTSTLHKAESEDKTSCGIDRLDRDDNERFVKMELHEKMPRLVWSCRRLACWGKQLGVCGFPCRVQKYSGGRFLQCGKRCVKKCDIKEDDVDQDLLHRCCKHSLEED